MTSLAGHKTLARLGDTNNLYLIKIGHVMVCVLAIVVKSLENRKVAPPIIPLLCERIVSTNLNLWVTPICLVPAAGLTLAAWRIVCPHKLQMAASSQYQGSGGDTEGDGLMDLFIICQL